MIAYAPYTCYNKKEENITHKKTATTTQCEYNNSNNNDEKKRKVGVCCVPLSDISKYTSLCILYTIFKYTCAIYQREKNTKSLFHTHELYRFFFIKFILY